MSKNEIINRNAIIKIANALGDLNEQVVFVGGAMVSLYADDPIAEDVRATKDIDLTFQIATASELEVLRQALIDKGFYESRDSDVICRFNYEDLLVDVMSTQPVGWAPGNRWFAIGFAFANTIYLENVGVKILPLSYFLASKIDAFYDRGRKDVYGSHDLEDIVYLFNYRIGIVGDISNSNQEVKSYLSKSLSDILADDRIMNALPGHLYFEEGDERMEFIKDKMRAVAMMV